MNGTAGAVKLKVKSRTESTKARRRVSRADQSKRSWDYIECPQKAQFYERLIQAVTAHAHLIYGTSSLYLWMDSLGERKKRRVKGKDDRERKGERLTKGQIETYRYTKKRREKDTQI